MFVYIIKEYKSIKRIKAIVKFVILFVIISFIAFSYAIYNTFFPNLVAKAKDKAPPYPFLETNVYFNFGRYEERRTNFSTIEIKRPWKNILFWTPFNGGHHFWRNVFVRHNMHECQEFRCHLLTSKDAIAHADAVVFNVNDLEQKKDKLRKKYNYPSENSRQPNQVYVFFTVESPQTMLHIELEKLTNFFNWTMTYRNDSDVPVPYGEVTERKEKQNKFQLVSETELKSRELAVWMVSHCTTYSKRELFVQELQKYIPVNVYGDCGSKKCGARAVLLNTRHNIKDHCEELMRNHAFYLALENSLCTDYITEKLYRTLTLDMIPVVLGDPDYSLFAPPNSYIDAKDFDTVADLANYMKKVANDVDLFNQYFKWKDYYDIQLGHPYKPLICGLCEKLYAMTEDSPHKSYEDIEKWYVDDGKCHEWTK